ncbi:chemotaxis protein CheX [uncultured Helicobacter sp.]|uniref:chemotaxis protein CheX n=1 Tax=uncultured Helicobacter sp. TaxID=175537 RepID=UPI001C3C1B5C|nr:chemotaxis protein CheX [Candidatus Helicobacter avicola]
MDTNQQSFDIIHQSFLEVVQESINKLPKDSILPIKKGYLTKISMLKGDVIDKDVFLLFDKAFLKIVAKALLEDTNPDKATLEDMAKELANLIVGHAKVIAKGNKSFNISVPSYLGYKLIKDYDSGLHFKLGRGHCGIYVRKV